MANVNGGGPIFTNTTNSLVLVVQNNPNPPLIWTGTAGSGGNGAWDTTSSNWDINIAPFASATYMDGWHHIDQSGINTNISLGGAR